MKRAYIFLLSFLIFSCSNELEKITPPDIRAAEAIDDLNEKLQAPSQGWKIDYQPTPESGIFQVIIDFKENGIASINSDLTDNNGAFVQQDIPYRIDNALAIELIFETYAVFHYLFELEQSQFGAEFEFLFEGEDGDDLVFSSKSDLTSPTLIRFTPASSSDLDQFSLEESKNITSYNKFTPLVSGGVAPIQRIEIPGRNVSLFWFIDITRRTITAGFISTGTTEAEVLASADKLKLNQTTTYKYSSGKIVLSEPLTFTFMGDSYSIGSVALDDFSTSQIEICSGTLSDFPNYTGSIEGLGSVNITKSFLEFEGLKMIPQTESPYSVNVFFAFDDLTRSLIQIGLLADRFPTATGIAFNYGFDSEEEPANAMGLYLEAVDGSRLTYLREFQLISQVGNRLEISFTNDFYYSDPISGTEEEDLTAFTDLMFEGGVVYIFDFPVDDVTVFRLFNPCNSHEFFLVQ